MLRIRATRSTAGVPLDGLSRDALPNQLFIAPFSRNIWLSVRSPCMQLVIRHQRTGKFLDQSGRWVSTYDEAARFRSAAKLIGYCLAHSITSQVEMVVLRPDEPEIVIGIFEE